MGDKSPKAAKKNATQKQSKNDKAKTLFGSSSSTAAKTTKERANVRRIRLD
jgi:hypothetical protein